MTEATQSHPKPPSSRKLPDRRRRGILGLMFGSFFGLGMTTLGTACGLWTAATARFLMPNTLNEPPNKFKVGFPDDYPPDHVETRFRDEHGVYVIHGTFEGQPQIYALKTTCTHLGCIARWQPAEGRFKCPCHGSGFHADGRNFEGPAPRPLERFGIQIADDGQLEVDKSLVYQQELGQWTDPSSYVETS